MQITNGSSYRVLFVSEAFWPFVGGAEISASLLLSRLALRGLKVSVLTHRFFGTKSYEFRDNLRINREQILSERPLDFYRRLLFYFKALLIISKYVLKEKPHVILTQQLVSPSAILVSKVFHIPVIVVIHDYWPICYYRSLLKPNGQICFSYDRSPRDIYACAKNAIVFEGPKKLKPILAMHQSVFVLIHTFLIKHVVKSADVIIAISNFVKKALLSNGFDPRKIRVIYTPVMVGNRIETQAKDFPTVLYVGRLDFEKGVEFLLKALQLVKMKRGKVRLLIVGRGREEKRLQRLAKNLRIEHCVEFLGRVSDETLNHLYSTSDIVAIPSIWAEPFGRVVVEAMMCGRPVVASNVGGISELVSPENGILVPPGDVVALADAITSLTTKKQGFKSNLVALERFLPDKVAALMFNVIKETVEAKLEEKNQ